MPETTPLPATEETSWQRFFRKSVEKFMGFSTFRKLFVGLSILAIPIEVSAAYWEQTRDVLCGAEGVISWLVLAAINAALFFWVWEELTELKPVNRRVALALLGVIVIVFFRREIRLTTEAADDEGRTR